MIHKHTGVNDKPKEKGSNTAVFLKMPLSSEDHNQGKASNPDK